MFLVRLLAGKAGQQPHQKKVLWGRRSRPHTPTNKEKTCQSKNALSEDRVHLNMYRLHSRQM
jgi:hypothetical protein